MRVRHLCARAAPALVQATTAAARALFLVESLGLGHFGDIAQGYCVSVSAPAQARTGPWPSHAAHAHTLMP